MTQHTPGRDDPVPQHIGTFIDRVSSWEFYSWPEDGSWTDQQAEDALVCLNWIIACARKYRKQAK